MEYDFFMSHNLIEIPVPITTDRLTIRPYREDDVPTLTEAYLESINELKPWLSWAHNVATEEPVSALQAELIFVRKVQAKWLMREELSFLITDKNDDTKIFGAICLRRINWAVPAMEIRYWLRTSMTGKGYMTETVNALCRYAFTQLHVQRIDLVCDESNIRSRAIPERLGFVQEGILKNYDRSADNNELTNMVVYARYNMQGLPTVDVSWPIKTTIIPTLHSTTSYDLPEVHT
jgi:RimJ/RimL family protein N-acetyltransferase